MSPGLKITGIAGLKGRRVALRQPKAGCQILLDHLLAAYFRAWVGNGGEGDRAANGT